MKRFFTLIPLTFWAGLAISCGGSSDDAGAIGDLCIEGKCAAGLSCAPSTVLDLAGRCTADCQNQTDATFCAAHFGAQATCYSRTFCAKKCSSASDCQGGYCTGQPNGDSVCLSN